MGAPLTLRQALVDAGMPLLGQVNPEMPFGANSPQIPVDRFTSLVNASTPIVEYDAGTPSETFRSVTAHMADPVWPGDTVQFGLGKLQPAVTDALSSIDDLAIHSGMISDAALAAMDKGEFNGGGKGIIATGKSMRGGPLIASFPVEVDQIMPTTSTGQSIRVPVEGISFQSRIGSGVRIFRLGEGEQVASVARIVDTGEE